MATSETNTTAPTTTVAPRASPPILATDDLAYFPPEERRVFAFSSGGDRVAFLSEPMDEISLHVVNSDGTDSRRLVTPDRNQFPPEEPALVPDEPAFAPDGSEIAFVRYLPTRTRGPDGSYRTYQTDVQLTDVDGTGLTNISDSDAVGGERYPIFSPDGQKVVYEAAGKGTDILEMSLDGNGPTNLTDSQGNDLRPAFSPDGEKIVFQSNRHGMTNFDIYVMDADGSSQVRLTRDSAWDHDQVFSADGKKVAFSRRELADPLESEVYVVNIDGTGLTRLTERPGYDGQPAFIPGTDRVAFVSGRDGDDDIYTVRLDGTNLTNLTDTDSASEARPLFSADGAKMAYAGVRLDRFGNQVNGVYVIELDHAE